jgi:hypothetical protein
MRAQTEEFPPKVHAQMCCSFPSVLFARQTLFAIPSLQQFEPVPLIFPQELVQQQQGKGSLQPFVALVRYC